MKIFLMAVAFLVTGLGFSIIMSQDVLARNLPPELIANNNLPPEVGKSYKNIAWVCESLEAARIWPAARIQAAEQGFSPGEWLLWMEKQAIHTFARGCQVVDGMEYKVTEIVEEFEAPSPFDSDNWKQNITQHWYILRVDTRRNERFIAVIHEGNAE